MKRLLITGLGIAACLASATPAHATAITYSTEGTFSCGAIIGCTVDNSAPGDASITLNGITIYYTATTDTTDPSLLPGGVANISYGAFSSTGTGPADFSGATFTTTITQSNPVPSGGSPFPQSGTVTGVIQSLASGTVVQFTQPFVNLVTFGSEVAIYSLVEADGGILGRSAIPKPGALPSSIEATLQVVPEPASLALLGTGLFAAAGMARRRFKNGQRG